MMSIPEDVLKNHLAILGKTGAGKTSTEKLAVEQVVAAGFRVCVLDSVKSDWWGITSSASGKQAGLPFQILGGPHGHVPLHSSAGKVIGQLVGAGKLPLSIIDMADFEAGGLQRFFIDFAQSLMRHAKGVVYLVIEEAHEFAPKERSGIGQENMAIHWAKKLATAGRSKGIRLIVATQRIQALHNAVLGSCETIIAHRLSAPADQEPISKWLKANTDKATLEKVMGSLSSLPTGTGWVCAGEAKIFEMMKFPKFKTYDNTATPTGDSAEVTIKTAPVDHDALRAIIGEAVEEALANDPVQLKKKIRELQTEIDKGRIKGSDVENWKAQRKLALNAAHKEGFADGLKPFTEMRENLKAATAEIESILTGVLRPSEPQMIVSKMYAADLRAAGVKNLRIAKPVQMTIDRLDKGSDDLADIKTETLSGPQQRIVDSLLFWRSVGTDAPLRAQVAAVAGYSSCKGSTFRNPLYDLSKAGVVKLTGKQVTPVSLIDGMTMTVTEAARKLRDVLSGPAWNLALTMARTTEPQTREWLAEQNGYASFTASTFRNPLYELSGTNIVEFGSNRLVTLTDWAREVLS